MEPPLFAPLAEQTRAQARPAPRRWMGLWLLALVLPGSAMSADDTDLLSAPYAQRVLAAVNEYRSRHGLPRLSLAPSLERIAVDHSVEMAAHRHVTHGGFRDRFNRADSTLCVENVAAGFAVPEQAVQGWRESPSHDRNLLERRVRWAGVASVHGYTTLFACESTGGRFASRQGAGIIRHGSPPR